MIDVEEEAQRLLVVLDKHIDSENNVTPEGYMTLLQEVQSINSEKRMAVFDRFEYLCGEKYDC
jgi:hemerythrin-like domain-containing protein